MLDNWTHNREKDLEVPGDDENENEKDASINDEAMKDD